MKKQFRKHHLYAAKFNVTRNLFIQEIDQIRPFFKEAVATSEKTIIGFKSPWNIIDAEKIIINNRELYAGRLCRGKSESKRFFDLVNAKITAKEIANVAVWSNFLFDYKTEIIVFEERVGKISRFQFPRMFHEIIQSNREELAYLSWELIPSEEGIREQLSEFATVNYAKFELRPANWDDDEEFSDLDEELKNLKTNKAVHEYESEENGLNTQSKLFKKPLNMTLAGYGKFKLDGKDKNGNHKELDSTKELIYDTVLSPDEIINDYIKDYFQFLSNVIMQHKGAQHLE